MPDNNLLPGSLEAIKVLRGSTVFLSIPKMTSTSHQISLDSNTVVTIPTPINGRNGVNMTASDFGIALVTMYDPVNKTEAQFEVEVLPALPTGVQNPTQYAPKFAPRVNKPNLDLITQQPLWNPTTEKWQYVFRLKPSPNDSQQVTHYGALYDLHKEQNTGDGELTGWQPLSAAELASGLYFTAEFAPGESPKTIVGAMSVSIPSGTKKSIPSDAVLVPVNGQVMPDAPVQYTLEVEGPIKPFNSVHFQGSGLTPGALYKLKTSAEGDLICQPAIANLEGEAHFEVLWPFDPDNIATATSLTIGLFDAVDAELVAPAQFTSDTAWAGISNLTVGRVGNSTVQVSADMDTNLSEVHIDLIKADSSKDYIDEPDPTIAADGTTSVNINEPLPGGTTLLVRLTSVPADGHPVVEGNGYSILQPIVLEKVAVSLTSPQVANSVPLGTPGARGGSVLNNSTTAHQPKEVVDNDTFTSFKTRRNPTTSPDGQWWEYEFAAPQVVKGVKLLCDYDPEAPKNFQILGSNDGVNYTLLRQPVYQALWRGGAAGADRGNHRMFRLDDNDDAWKIVRIQNLPVAANTGMWIHEAKIFADGFDPEPDFGVVLWARGRTETGGYELFNGQAIVSNEPRAFDIRSSSRGTLYLTLDGSDPLTSATRLATAPNAGSIFPVGSIAADCTARYAIVHPEGTVTGQFSFARAADWKDWEAIVTPGGTFTGPVAVQVDGTFDRDVSQWENPYYTTDGSDPRSSATRTQMSGTSLQITTTTTLKVAIPYRAINPANPAQASRVYTPVVEETYTIT